MAKQQVCRTYLWNDASAILLNKLLLKVHVTDQNSETNKNTQKVLHWSSFHPASTHSTTRPRYISRRGTCPSIFESGGAKGAQGWSSCKCPAVNYNCIHNKKKQLLLSQQNDIMFIMRCSVLSTHIHTNTKMLPHSTWRHGVKWHVVDKFQNCFICRNVHYSIIANSKLLSTHWPLNGLLMGSNDERAMAAHLCAPLSCVPPLVCAVPPQTGGALQKSVGAQ